MNNVSTGLIISPNPKAQQIAGELLNILPATVVDVSFSQDKSLQKQLHPYKKMHRLIAVGGDGACLKAMRVAFELS